MDSTALQERLARRLPEALGAGVPGIGVALLAGPEVVWAAAVGVADAATGAPLTPASVFEGASLSKPVFAGAVLRLWEAGVLDLDRPLSDYLPAPYLPDEPRLPLITARLVLAHRTGLPNWRGRGRLLALGAPPGARFGYSGEGYVYLQRAVEQLIGAPLQEVVAARVLAPLGLAHSSYVWRPAYAQTAARGHRADGTPLEKGRPAAAQRCPLAAHHADRVRPFRRSPPGPRGRGPAPRPDRRRDARPANPDRRPAGVGPRLGPPAPGRGQGGAGGGWSLWHWGDNSGYKHVALIGREQGLVVMTNGDRGLTACRALVREATGADAPLFEFLDAFERHVVRVEPGAARPAGPDGGRHQGRPIVMTGSVARTRRSDQVGAWGAGSFENDAALDWVAELEAADGPEVLDRALRRVTEAGDGYLEVDDGAAASRPPRSSRRSWARRRPTCPRPSALGSSATPPRPAAAPGGSPGERSRGRRATPSARRCGDFGTTLCRRTATRGGRGSPTSSGACTKANATYVACARAGPRGGGRPLSGSPAPSRLGRPPPRRPA